MTSLSSWGKYLVSVSQDEDLIVVYDYQKQEDYRHVSLRALHKSGDTKLSPRGQKAEKPTYALVFKDLVSQRDLLLIATDGGTITCYDLDSKQFSQVISANCPEKSKQLQQHSLHLKQKSKINQILRLAPRDKASKNGNMFAAQSISNELVVFSVTVAMDVESAGERHAIKYIQIQE